MATRKCTTTVVAANLIITMINPRNAVTDPDGRLSHDALATQILIAVDGLARGPDEEASDVSGQDRSGV